MEGKPKQKNSWVSWFHQIFQRGVSKLLNSRIQISMTQEKFWRWKHSLNFLKKQSSKPQAEKQSKKHFGIFRMKIALIDAAL